MIISLFQAAARTCFVVVFSLLLLRQTLAQSPPTSAVALDYVDESLGDGAATTPGTTRNIDPLSAEAYFKEEIDLLFDHKIVPGLAWLETSVPAKPAESKVGRGQLSMAKTKKLQGKSSGDYWRHDRDRVGRRKALCERRRPRIDQAVVTRSSTMP
jgi:hypothetical protein